MRNLMKTPPIPLNETARLQTLHSLRILDSMPEERFDRITRMAQRVFDVDISVISLVDSDRQWYKSRQGISARETPRSVSFCAHVILAEDVLVVEDALLDDRFADNPLVTGEPAIRFYAGYPIHAPNGQRVGALCVVDRAPRDFAPGDMQTLKDFAALVDDELASSSQLHVDELTGIANRRGFTTVAQYVLPLCVRNGLLADLLYFDLDDFKELNDKYGHEAGDRALRFFAVTLLKSFRTADVVSRLGGDEFVVLMAGKRVISERSLNSIQAHIDSAEDEIARTLKWSVGRIQYDQKRHADVEDFLAEADRRMYANKSRKTRASA
jgi:diguanylate cyclase (GGDEF)-like protein